MNTFRSLVDRWGFEAGAPDLLALRDAYLEPWTTFAPLSRLTELFEAAYPLGMLCRAAELGPAARGATRATTGASSIASRPHGSGWPRKLVAGEG